MDKIHDGNVLPKLADDITIKQNKQVDAVIADGHITATEIFSFWYLRQ